ncbi:MAG: glycoside hydrolase family 92 protein, partial [Oscillospiraceae bacterium]|nr:glycoside hydrolase family 92 protein [Oscillospiraceae bacterium]
MNYIPYVNIKMGTDSHRRFSNGSTLPLTQLPWAMAGFMPQTVSEHGWFFQPHHRYIEGFRLTHQPSPWIRDYGTFLMTPQADIRFDNPANGWSSYRPEEATFRPDVLKVRFLRQRCDFSLTPTPRGAAIRLHYDLFRNVGLTFYPLLGENKWRFDEKTNTLLGWTNGHSVDKTSHFQMYIAVRFEEGDVDAAASGAFVCGELGEGYHVMFNKADITARLAISYLSEEQALYNLNEELSGKSFDELQKNAEDIWEEYLHRIEIESDDEAQLKTFYSCLYRTALYPHMTYEHDLETGENVYLCPFDGEKKKGVRYTDNGFWDTYRTVYPLYALIARDKYAEMLEAFVNDYRDGGWLPRWPSYGEVGCMPSTLIDATIADAVVKGIGSKEVWKTALEGMLKHANVSSGVNHFGRNGVLEYCKYGYVPIGASKETVNLTLDAAY